MIFSQKYFQSKNSSTNFTLFSNGSFFLASLSMGGWLEKMIHLIKRHPMRIQLYSINKKSSKNLSVLAGGGWRGLSGVRVLLFSVEVSVGFVRVCCMEVAALLFDWRPLGAPRGVR